SGSSADLQTVAFSPDGKILAVGDFAGGKVWLWNPASGRLCAPPLDAQPLGTLWRLRFDPSGRYLPASGTGGLMAWAVRSSGTTVNTEVFTHISTPNAYDFALHPSGYEWVYFDELLPRPVAYDLRNKTGPRPLAIPFHNYFHSLHFDRSGCQLHFC